MIHVKDLVVRRSDKIICRVDDLNVEAGSRLWLHGTNGSGKSTFLRVLSGLERQYEGQVELEISPTQCTYLCQDPYLFRGGLRYNLGYGLVGSGLAKAERKAKVEAAITEFRLAPLLTHNLNTVSGGEKQRIALARALIMKPKLLLLDEPYAELDDDHSQNLDRILRQSEGTTVIMSSPQSPPKNWSGETHDLSITK